MTLSLLVKEIFTYYRVNGNRSVRLIFLALGGMLVSRLPLAFVFLLFAPSICKVTGVSDPGFRIVGRSVSSGAVLSPPRGASIAFDWSGIEIHFSTTGSNRYDLCHGTLSHCTILLESPSSSKAKEMTTTSSSKGHWFRCSPLRRASESILSAGSLALLNSLK